MTGQFWDRFQEVFRWKVMLFLLLNFIVMASFTGTVTAVVPHLTWGFLVPAVLYGLILGWLFGHYQLQDKWFAAGGILLGLSIALIRAGNLRAPLFRVLNLGLSYLWQTMAGNGAEQLRLLGESWGQLASQTGSVLFGLQQWVVDLSAGSPKYSFLASRFLWVFLIWAFSLWLSWSIRRYYRPIWGFVPVGTFMAVLLTYIPGKRLYLLAFALGAGLALLGLGFFERKKVHWDQKGVPYYARVEKNITGNIVLVSILVMIIAASVPSVSIDAITEPIQEWNRERAGDGQMLESLGVEYQPGPAVGQLAKITQLPRSHLIGSGPDLKERVVMVVTQPGGIGEPQDLPKEARYWRAFTYDQYTGLGWTSSTTIERQYAPGEVMTDYFADHGAKVVQEMRLSEKITGPLYAPGLPLTINREYQTFWRTTSQQPEDLEDEELIYEDIFAVSVDRNHYQVESVIPRVDEEVLRASSDTPPEWIRERYIDLPRGTPFRVIEFAVRLVEDDQTNYDKAKTIENFLRGYEYSLDLPAPPKEGDLVDYFLFRLEKGYCDYYASSMVVLARAAGIPARLAVGYVDGTYDEEGDRFLVTEADAHSWPELYFTGIGWVPFEPTAQRSVIEHQDKELPVPPELEEPPVSGRQPWGLAGLAGTIFLVCLGTVALVALLLVFWYDPWQLRQGSPNDTFLKVLQRLYRVGVWIELDLTRPATPYQFLETFNQRLSEILEKPQFDGLAASVGEGSRRLVHWFVNVYYGPHPAGESEQQQVIQEWMGLRWQLLLVLGFYYWQKFRTSLKTLPSYLKMELME